MAKSPKKKLEEIIQETEVKEGITKVTKNAIRALDDALSRYPKEDIEELENLINNSKDFEGIPKGTISFKGKDISLDLIFSNFRTFRYNYETAIHQPNEEGKKNRLNHANRRLIHCILFLMDKVLTTKDEIIINGKNINLEDFNIDEFESKLCSRDNVAEQIYKIRSESKILNGSIELRKGVNIDLSDDKFASTIEEYQQEYNNAKDESTRAELDTRLAEHLILKAGYIIQINNQTLPTRDSNYKSSGELLQNLKDCKEGLERIGILTDAIQITHNGKIFYAIKSLEDTVPTPTPTPIPSPTPTPIPSPTPTPIPSPTPTPIPSPTPTPIPTPTPTPIPTPTPTPIPTPTPTPIPTPTPTPIPTPTPTPIPTPTPTETELPISFKVEGGAVISDVSESYEDLISREVENEINEEWHNTARYNVFKRGKLWLMRGRIRKKKIEEMKKNYERTPFTNNGLINKEMSTQAARHDLEEILGKKGVKRDAFGEIDRKNIIATNEVSGDPLYETARGKEFREMCQDYVAGTISQIEFQNKFNKFVKVRLGLPKEQQFVATNVLEKLDAIKNDNELLKDITKELEAYLKPNDHKTSHFDVIRKKIDDDFKKYRKDPRFRKEIMDILGNTSGLTKEQLDEKINKFIRHQKALAKMSTQNLQIKLDLLTNGKGAYQTNNKDRENWLFRFGNKLDKMPRWGQALTVAGISASGMLVAGLGGSALAATATMSGLVGAKNFIKKWTHHTKEQNTYEKNLTRNYEEEIAKMKEWERIRDEKDSEGKYTHGRFARYKAKRQLELYGKTTQSELQNENTGNTKEISDFIYAALERYDSLNSDEKNALNCTLLDAKARLETYWSKGHNFLKSKDKNQIERDFYDLENALSLSATRILGTGATLKDISLINAYDGSGKAVNYNDLLNLYKKDYNSATKEFRGERAWLATKWGISTAAITFGTSAAIQYATGTGMFAKEAVPGTPGTPDSTSTTNTGNVTDNFGMGQYELSGGNKIFQTAQDNISSLNSTDTVTLHLGAGTDGTAVRAGSSLLNHSTYLDKLDQVKDVIAHSSLSNKSDLINQINSGFSTSGFTNTDLHGMRCLEAIEETVKGAGNFAGSLNISYDPVMNIDGAIAHDATARMANAFLEISKFVPGEPGTPAIEGGKQRLVLGLPWFSNTFKRKNNGKPKDKGPNGKGPDSKGPDSKGPDSKGPDSKGPDSKGPDSKGPDSKGPDSKGPDSKGPDSKGPDIILPPVDPDDPAGPTEDEKPREKITGVKRGIITRGHQIYTDKDDLGESYPYSGKTISVEDAANKLLSCWQNVDLTCFTKNDRENLRQLEGNNEAQLQYLESKIIEDRNEIEKSTTMENFKQSMETSKKWIKEFLPEIVGDIDSNLLNKFLSDDRIHVVSDREYIGVIGQSKRSSGVFRTLDGDVYIRYSYIQEHENDRIYSADGKHAWGGMLRHDVLIHEMVHSMSTMNYIVSESEKDKKLEYDLRRVGLQQMRWNKNGKFLGETGRSINEASTESLCWEIVSRGFNSLGLDLSAYRESNISYKSFIDVIDQLEEVDHIENKDFWKAMLIRKRAKKKEIEKNTPLYELMGKVNGRYEENGHIKFSRPDYYNIISNCMDFSGKRGDYNTSAIVDFITKKDINILKEYIRRNHRRLSDVFDKDLLTKDGKDFKQEILDAYQGS